MSKIEDPHHRLLSIIREFAVDTTAHGLPRIVRSNNWPGRLFWGISFFGFTGVMIYFIVSSIRTYLSYPTNMDINYSREWPQYFPAVSICNAATMRADQFMIRYLNRTSNNKNNSISITDLSLFDIYNFLITETNNNRSVANLFYPLPTILYSCTFNSYPCTYDDFIIFGTSAYGQCFTFNPQLKNNDNYTIRYADQYGGTGVLSLGFYIYPNDLVPQITTTHGIISLIHDNTVLPEIEAAGIELAPGRKHKLGFRKKTVTFLSAPYSSCTTNISPIMESVFENYNGADYGYSITTCYRLCEQAFVYSRCGCVRPMYWNVRAIVLPGSNNVFIAPLCSSNDTCPNTAINVLATSRKLMDSYCSECKSECSIVEFDVQVSSLEQNLDTKIKSIQDFVEKSPIPLPENWSTNAYDFIRKNYLSVDIVLETSIVEQNTQTASMSFTDLISNIGGHTGLWIGISFLSLMEVIEMVGQLVRLQCCAILKYIYLKKHTNAV